MNSYFKDGLCLTRDPSDSNVVYAGGGVYISGTGYQLAIQKSTDAGATWTPTPIGPAGGFGTFLHCLAVAPTDIQVLYTGGETDRYVTMWRSPDGGATWSDITNNLASYHAKYDEISTVWVSPEDEDSLLVGTPHGVFASSDGGGTWSTTGLTTNVQDIVYFPASDTLFAGTLFNGVYQSTDRGLTWQAMNNGLSSQGIRCLAIDTKNSLLFAGTSNGSTWRFPLPVPVLNYDVTHLPESTGGVVTFTLDAEVANAGRNYLILSGTSGTSPGFPLPGGLASVPVNWDWFTDLEMSLLNTVFFQSFVGSLDVNGTGVANFYFPGYPGTAGLKFYFAFCCNNPFDFVSNSVVVGVVP